MGNTREGVAVRGVLEDSLDPECLWKGAGFKPECIGVVVMPVGVGRTVSAAVTDSDFSLGCVEFMTQEDLEGILLAFYDVRQERKAQHG